MLNYQGSMNVETDLPAWPSRCILSQVKVFTASLLLGIGLWAEPPHWARNPSNHRWYWQRMCDTQSMPLS